MSNEVAISKGYLETDLSKLQKGDDVSKSDDLRDATEYMVKTMSRSLEKKMIYGDFPSEEEEVTWTLEAESLMEDLEWRTTKTYNDTMNTITRIDFSPNVLSVIRKFIETKTMYAVPPMSGEIITWNFSCGRTQLNANPNVPSHKALIYMDEDMELWDIGGKPAARSKLTTQPKEYVKDYKCRSCKGTGKIKKGIEDVVGGTATTTCVKCKGIGTIVKPAPKYRKKKPTIDIMEELQKI